MVIIYPVGALVIWVIFTLCRAVILNTEEIFKAGARVRTRESSRHREPSVGEKTEAVDRIEKAFKESFALARECPKLAEVETVTSLELGMIGIEEESAEDEYWHRTKEKVIDKLTETYWACEYYLKEIEPSAKILKIERFTEIAILVCKRCPGPSAGLSGLKCQTLEVLSNLGEYSV
jgi:hypothetical protein